MLQEKKIIGLGFRSPEYLRRILCKFMMRLRWNFFLGHFAKSKTNKLR